MLKIYLINLLLIIFFVAAHFEEPIHKSNVLTTKNNFQVDRSSLDN